MKNNTTVLAALSRLIQFERYLLREDFAGLYAKVRQYPVQSIVTDATSTIEVKTAVRTACLWYPKRVLCLQRSAVTVCMLRDRGFAAHLMFGAQVLPFKAHAWVEVDNYAWDGAVENRASYPVLDRC
jgi:hypothetical protein